MDGLRVPASLCQDTRDLDLLYQSKYYSCQGISRHRPKQFKKGKCITRISEFSPKKFPVLSDATEFWSRLPLRLCTMSTSPRRIIKSLPLIKPL
mmetsp:Transcript_28665/g.59957  ORF Transcript_28665/g.59957 Transcript_28665/m.59957 type:complete len:94 (+) Transcript_28665:1557-1838(+)